MQIKRRRWANFFFDKTYYYCKDSKEAEEYLEKSRYISFINENISFKKIFFIHDQNSLNLALKEARITESIIEKGNEKRNYDSNDSNSSSKNAENLNAEDILEESISAIKQQKYIKISKIFSKGNFDKRFINGKVKELDFNSKYYKDLNLNNNIKINEENKKIINDIAKFYSNRGFNSELYILGPRGIGKTVSLLEYLRIAKIPRLYFPISKLVNYNNRKWKKIALYESIYIFQNEEEMEKFQKSIENMPNSEDLIQFIYDFIKFILDFYKEKQLKKRILVILDDYDNSLDKYNNILNIIEYVHKKRYNILLFILGECPYIYKKYYDYILNNNKNYNVIYWDLPFKNDEKENLFKLPLYYYRFKEKQNNQKSPNDSGIEDSFKNLIKKEIKEDFKKINLRNFLTLSKYLDVISPIDNLADDFEYLPLEFLSIEIKTEKKNILIKLSFKLDIYKEVFDESIKGLLKIDNIKNTFYLDKDNIVKDSKGKYGVQFEDLIVEQLWNNLFDFINFPDKNKIKVKDIFGIKNYNGNSYSIDKGKPIIIRQTEFCGKYYDLLLVVSNKSGERFGIFIQIGINKDRFEINKYYNNIIKYVQEYKDGIFCLINEKIEDLGFLLIFDYDNQILLKQANNETEGVGYCSKENISYLIYRDFQLFESLDSKMPITSLDVDNTLIHEIIKTPGFDLIKNVVMEFLENMSNMNAKPYINIDGDLKKKIINFINIEYSKDFNDLQFVMTMGEKIDTFFDIGYTFKEDHLSIFRGKKFKYISYKNELFKIVKNSIKKSEENINNLIKKEDIACDLYLLQKGRINKIK